MSKNSDISTLIFDLGGVLVDLDRERCIREFEKLGVSNISTILSTTVQKGFIWAYEIGKISTEDFRDAIRACTPNTLSDQQIDQAWNALLVGLPTSKLNLLRTLREQYRIIMLSNTNPLSYAYCRDVLFTQEGKTIADYFDKCYLSYEMKAGKPHKEIFQTLLAQEGGKPSDFLFLDDSTQNIETAKALGIQTHWVQPYTTLSANDFLP